jgi:two-component system alkaline phosphatase synthesis response regulator PhoP
MDGQKKILMIDDDSFFTSIITNAFAKHGCEIHIAGSGEAGLDAARKEKPDFILLDMAMSGMDGLATLAALKKDPATADIPVAIFSGSAGQNEEDKHEQAKVLGAVDFLEKMQFTPEQLWEHLAQYLVPKT